jgi:hypothetical protein
MLVFPKPEFAVSSTWVRGFKRPRREGIGTNFDSILSPNLEREIPMLPN